jgi:hypothetical protein
MNQYSLTEGLYLYPTPAGAYYAVSANDLDKPRQFIRQILQQLETQALTTENLIKLSGLSDPQKCFELLYRCQKLGWVQGLTAKRAYPDQLLENILPNLLGKMSESGKVLLADMQGFYLASHGFPHEVAEELSALSAELASIHKHRSGVLSNLGLTSQSWAIVDVFGNSQIGFWPLFIGKNRFVIVISGVPHFNQPELVDLIWTLSVRYAGQSQA